MQDTAQDLITKEAERIRSELADVVSIYGKEIDRSNADHLLVAAYWAGHKDGSEWAKGLFSPEDWELIKP